MAARSFVRSRSAFAQSTSWIDLAKRQPATTNVLMAIDAEAMLQSEIAIRNDWRELQAENFDRNPTLLPPQAKRVLLGSELNLEFFEPLRELAIIETSQPITLDQIRADVKGVLDEIDGHAALVTQNGSYVIPYDANHVAVYRLGSRQWAAQQMRAGQQRAESVLALPLSDALKQVERGESQIVIAVNLADVVSRSEFVDLLQSTAAVSRGTISIDPAQIASLVNDLATLEGLVFSIHFDDSIHGRLELAFRDNITIAREIGKFFWEIASIYEDAETTIRYRSDNENPPPIQWRTDIIPYRTFVTPYGRFYRYRPFNYAHSNIPGNLARSQQIAMEELAKANQKASEVLAAIEGDVLRMNQYVK